MRFLTLCLALCVLISPAIAATVVVYPNGTANVAVPAGQFINVFTSGSSSAQVFKQVGFPNYPSSFALETNGVVANQERSFGPYTNATNIRIEASTDPVLYSVGAGAVPIPVSVPAPALTAPLGATVRIGAQQLAYLLPAPTAMTGAASITSAALLGRLITGTHTAGATAAYTLPTGTLLDAAAGNMQINDAFEWTLINLSVAALDSITVTAAAGHTIVGNPIVISAHSTTGGTATSHGCSSSNWITQKTAANTFVTYRKN